MRYQAEGGKPPITSRSTRPAAIISFSASVSDRVGSENVAEGKTGGVRESLPFGASPDLHELADVDRGPRASGLREGLE